MSACTVWRVTVCGAADRRRYCWKATWHHTTIMPQYANTCTPNPSKCWSFDYFAETPTEKPTEKCSVLVSAFFGFKKENDLNRPTFWWKTEKPTDPISMFGPQHWLGVAMFGSQHWLGVIEFEAHVAHCRMASTIIITRYVIPKYTDIKDDVTIFPFWVFVLTFSHKIPWLVTVPRFRRCYRIGRYRESVQIQRFALAAEACRANAVISDYCAGNVMVCAYCGSVPCKCRDRE